MRQIEDNGSLVFRQGIAYLQTLLAVSLIPRRDGTTAELSESVQSGDLDTLSVIGACGGHFANLYCGWYLGSDIGIGTNTCWDLSEP